jgi:hypothetical protein
MNLSIQDDFFKMKGKVMSNLIGNKCLIIGESPQVHYLLYFIQLL